MEREKLLENAGGHGVNRVVFRVVRFFFLPFFRTYFRLSTLGREHVPKSGATIYACNHRSLTYSGRRNSGNRRFLRCSRYQASAIFHGRSA